jgi:hypothetical protein
LIAVIAHSISASEPTMAMRNGGGLEIDHRPRATPPLANTENDRRYSAVSKRKKYRETDERLFGWHRAIVGCRINREYCLIPACHA